MADFQHPVFSKRASATFSKKAVSNGNGYEDVFGASPKFSASSFVARIEDYGEIFSSFYAPKTPSSIPVLDFPEADGEERDELSIDVRSPNFDYSEVFGGLECGDFAISYDEMFAVSEEAENPSAEYPTPAEKDSHRKPPFVSRVPSNEHKDPLACSQENHSLSNGTSLHYDGAKQFNVPYNMTNQGGKDDLVTGVTDIAQLHEVPGFSCVVDACFPSLMTKCDKLLPQATDDLSISTDSNVEITQGNHFSETVSHVPFSWEPALAGPAPGYDPVIKTSENYLKADKKQLESNVPASDHHVHYSDHLMPSGDKYYPGKEFLTVSDINLQTQPSRVPPPSKTPPRLVVEQGDSKGMMGASTKAYPDATHIYNALTNDRAYLLRAVSETHSLEDSAKDNSLHCFDVEVDASSAAAASAAAMKEAMEKAEARIRSAKQLMERKRDHFQSRMKLGLTDDKKGQEKRDKIAQDHKSKEVNHEICEKENGEKDSFSGEQRHTNLRTSHIGPDEGYIELAKETIDKWQRKKSAVTLESCKQEDGAGEWKAEKQFYELVKDENFKEVTAKSNECKLNEKKVVGESVGLKKKEKSRALKEACEWEENDRRLKASSKDIHVWEENEKKSKTSHEQEESEKNLNSVTEASKREESEKRLKAIQDALEWEENEKRSKEAQEACEREENEKRLKAVQEARELQENEKRLKESQVVLEQEENEKRLKAAQEAFKREESEKKLKEAREAREREEKEKKIKEEREAREWEENEKRIKAAQEACEREENEKRAKAAREAHEQEEIEKRLKAEQDARKWEEYEKRLTVAQKAREQEENERRMQSAQATRERDENEKKLKAAQEPHEQEENEKKLKAAQEAHEYEENEKKIKALQKALEHEEEKKKLRAGQEAHEHEENVMKLKETQEARQRKENNKKPKACYVREHEDNKKSFAAKEAQEFENHKKPEADKLAQEQEKSKKKLKAPQEAHEYEKDEKKLKAVKEAQGENKKKLNTFEDACELEENNNKPKGGAQEVSKHEENKQKLQDENAKNLKTVNEAYEKKEIGKKLKTATETNGCEKSKQIKPDKDALLQDGNKEKLREAKEAFGGEISERKTKVSQVPSEPGKIEQQKQMANKAYEIGENEKNIREADVALDLEESKNQSKTAQAVFQWLENVRKLKASTQAFVLEEKENVARTAPVVTLIQGTERKEKNANETRKTEEKERDRVQREIAMEMERARKVEEEREREREREKDRIAVERATLEARDRTFVEARERAERAAVERATAEVRQRAMADARERAEKASAEARERSLAEKASMEARLRAERAAVERATAEARERAVERAMAERAASELRERVERSGIKADVAMRQSCSFPDVRDFAHDSQLGAEDESAKRCKAKLERHQRTVKRAAKALAEKNMRDILAQREQAERNRLAETLDADVKRWSNGKEGNLRALLSTLQYILGPESGWHPIPLTDVITAVAVKKAYRKATLCVHPDKVQQRGASIQQKYICEKVFDLLKEAWNKFNSEER